MTIAWPACLAGLALLLAGAARACEPDRIEFLTAKGTPAFTIEIADDEDERSRGLMFRKSLDTDAGMLFVYDPPERASFWMKNTFIPLDMIFIDDTGRVESIAAGTVPFSVKPHSSEGAVRAVLEIGAGLAAHNGIAPGVQARHPAFAEAPAAARCGP